MYINLEQTVTEFHNRAREAFFSLFRDFTSSIDTVDRRRDESVFRQHREQYVNQLQIELQQIAQETLSNKKTISNIGELSQSLNHYIDEYIHQFVLKVKAL
jgi:hypothetical protein